MQVELWHILAVFGAVIAGLWTAIAYVNKMFNDLDAKMTRQHEARTTSHDNFRAASESNFAGLRQKDAELALNIATLRLEVAREAQNFVTREELDRRMERLENFQVVQNNKLDEIIRRLPNGV